MSNSNGKTVYDRVIEYLFSGDKPPGSKVVEQELADELGVSRIPIRESLGKLVGQGLLVGEKGGRGVRMREYSIEEIRQLYEARGTIEGGIARAATRAATETDIARLQIICEQAESEIGHYGSKRWAELDHAFHAALADASHNERLAHQLKLMLVSGLCRKFKSLVINICHIVPPCSFISGWGYTYDNTISIKKIHLNMIGPKRVIGVPPFVTPSFSYI